MAALPGDAPPAFDPLAFDADAFLRDHWQKSPCVIRNPWRNWRNPLAPDDLAGLACEDGSEARIVTRTPKRWKVEHGSFNEKRFARAGKAPWTLLVQAVDQVVPDVAALIAPFRFVPDWRIDDVMVSYATDGGGVGPHYDQYDVFLIQGLGQRRWRIGGLCDTATPLLPHDDLRLLGDFDATADWVLGPGDILYLPPRFAHDGIAVGDDCMTYSVGFRAPSRAELVAHWCDHLLDTLADDDRYADPDLRRQPNPGEIAPAALARLHAMVTESLADRAAFARWFGRYCSTRKYPDADTLPDTPMTPAKLRKALARSAALVRNPASRFAFVRQADAVELFVDGDSHACTGDLAMFAQRLCAAARIEADAAAVMSDAAVALAVRLYNQGSLMFEPQD